MIHFKIRNKYFINVETTAKTLNVFFSKSRFLKKLLISEQDISRTDLHEILHLFYISKTVGKRDINSNKKFFSKQKMEIFNTKNL